MAHSPAMGAAAPALSFTFSTQQLRAEMDYQQGMRDASTHGKGLRAWRDDKPLKLSLLEDFRRALQPALFLN